MRDENGSKARRVAAGIMGAMILAALLFSAFYIACEADHECCGDGCLVCACLRQCENTLRGIGSGAEGRLSAACHILPALFIAVLSAAAVFPETPVSRKARLNN